ncbi:MAG: hypothetical protein ACTSUE_23340 [Promethearchaeota archaeon]
MKFIKGFLISIALYIGLSLVFSVALLSISGGDIGALLSSTSGWGSILYQDMAVPTISNVITITLAQVATGFNLPLTLLMLDYTLPIAVAAIIGSLVERKAGSVKYIFISTFLGLMTCLIIGDILIGLNWSTIGTTTGYAQLTWFLIGTLITGAINGAIWCSVGLLVTRKKWD